MSDINQEELIIDEDELCEYIATKLGINADTVALVLDAEMEFLESKGMVVEVDPSRASEAPTPMNDAVEIDNEELLAYIISTTELSEKVVTQVLTLELEYIESQA